MTENEAKRIELLMKELDKVPETGFGETIIIWQNFKIYRVDKQIKDTIKKNKKDIA